MLEILPPAPAVVRMRTDTDDTIRRSVTVDRARSAEKTLRATRRERYVTDPGVLKAMPNSRVAVVEVVFFPFGNLDRPFFYDNVNDEYRRRGLRPADPYALAAVNEADPAFADAYRNATHWEDTEWKVCYAAFFKSEVDVRTANVLYYSRFWMGQWYFAGVSK